MFEWIIVGLVSGWLAGKIINGVGYGMFCDIMLGLVGGVVGGIIFEILGVRAHNFVGNLRDSRRARAQLCRRGIDVHGWRHCAGRRDTDNSRRDLSE